MSASRPHEYRKCGQIRYVRHLASQTYRKCMKDPIVKAKYEEKQAAHKELFDALMTSLESLVEDLIKVKGGYVHEWGASNQLWGDPRMRAIIQKLGLQRVYFDGCAVGLRARSGKLIKKPWAFMTNIQEIRDIFQHATCRCPHDTHARCKGKDAEMSAFYTWKMTDWIHRSIREHVNEKLPKIQTTEEALVKSQRVKKGWSFIDDLLVHCDQEATAPKDLDRRYSPTEWPVRTSLALMKAPGLEDEWVALEDAYRWRVPSSHKCPHSVFEPTRVVTIYQSFKQCAASESESEVDVNYVQDLRGAPIPTDVNVSASSGTASPWVVSWGIDQEDEKIGKANPAATVHHVDKSQATFKQFSDLHDNEEEAKFIQAAAAEGRIEALTLAHRWILDTGCGKDLIGMRMAMKFQSYITTLEPYTFNTAGRVWTADQGFPVYVSAFLNQNLIQQQIKRTRTECPSTHQPCEV